MCIQDLWIARHTYAVPRGTLASPITFPRNPLRVGILVSRTGYLILSDPNGRNVAVSQFVQTITSVAGTDSNDVPPTPSTQSYTYTYASTGGNDTLFHISRYGSLIQGELTLSGTPTTREVWELLMDDVLARRLSDMEVGTWK